MKSKYEEILVNGKRYLKHRYVWEQHRACERKGERMSGSIFIYDGSKYSNKEPSVRIELCPGGYSIKFDDIIAIDNFVLQLEDLRKKMEDTDMLLDILNVIS